MNDGISPPATAYFIVAALLGDAYFLRKPPRSGVRVFVTSVADQRITEWYMENDLAAALIKRLADRRDLSVSSQYYELREAA